MQNELIGNLGYFSLIKQADPNTPLTPDDYVPIYDESINTNLNLIDQTPIYGEKFENFDVVQGMRSHRGDVTVLGEPNVTAKLFDMLLARVATSGAGPYTHTFELSKTANPNPYTVDISTGNVVSRYWGVEASQISPDFNGNELRWKVSVSALGSFQSRTVATVATTTITLDTSYDSEPTKGLVVGDLVRVYKESDGSTLDSTVATIDSDGVTITLADSAAAFDTGDVLHLRPATVAFNILGTFLWARSQFRFGATAAAALTAAQVRIEDGSTYDVIHGFENDDGSMRSGGFDPASLPRTTGKANLTIKKIFTTPEDIEDGNNLTKSSMVVRHFAGANNQYEARLSLNNIKADGTIVPDLSSGEIEYSTINYHPVYDRTDGKGMQVVVVNGLATI